MSIELFQNNDYKHLTSSQVKELITFLQNNNQEFNLTANINAVDFNPKLPKKIQDSFNKFVLFTLANFTYSSLIIKDTVIEFEAGFGAENFGSVCTIPLYAVFQLGIDDSIIFINPIATVDKYFDENEEVQKERSMNAFKSLSKDK